MNIVHSDGDLCNHDIAKLPTYRGGRRTDNKLSKLFKIIYLASFILLSTLARICAKLALMRKKIAKFQHGAHGATIAPWFQQVDRAYAPLTLLYSTSNHSDLAVRFVHVESCDQFRHMHSARFLRMPDLGEKRGEHAGENGFLLKKWQKVAAKFGISVKHEL